MTLYLMRHAEAESGGPDAERRLSDRGRDEARLVGRALARLEPGLSRILTSPLARAAETGRIVAGSFPAPPPVEETDAISPGFRRTALLAHLATYGAEATVLAVGHQPDMGSFLSWLIADAPGAGIGMTTASMAVLTMRQATPDGEPVLRALVTPALLRALDDIR